jgi:3-oxoacyl-(acyl-carrier-protein) synthase
MPFEKEIFISGAGIISAIGNSWNENFFSLQHGLSGVSNMLVLDSIHTDIPVGEVKLTNQELAYRSGVANKSSRASLLGIHAAKEAYVSSGIKNMNFWRVGFACGTMTAGMDRFERFYRGVMREPEKAEVRDALNFDAGRNSEIIADAIGVKSFITTLNTATNSGLNAIVYGARLIKHNICDIVFVGGTDALSKYTLNGFRSTGLLDNTICKPFGTEAHGVNLGEGAAFLVLVSEEVAEEEELKPFAKVCGWGQRNDAFHTIAHSPEGRGAVAAMSDALKYANLTPDEINYVNLHGAGMIINDTSEASAVKTIFQNSNPSMSSTKGYTGCALGACGAIESVFSLMSLKHQVTFSNLNVANSALELSLTGNFEERNIRNVMTNGFGIGGHCTSVIYTSDLFRSNQ